MKIKELSNPNMSTTKQSIFRVVQKGLFRIIGCSELIYFLPTQVCVTQIPSCLSCLSICTLGTIAEIVKFNLIWCMAVFLNQGHWRP